MDLRVDSINKQRGIQLPKLLDAIDRVAAPVDPIAENWEARSRAVFELSSVCEYLQVNIHREIQQKMAEHIQPLRELLE